MAYVNADNALQRIRELAQEGAGSVRAIASTRFRAGVYDGQPEDESARQGITDEVPIGVRLVALRPHPSRLTITGTVQIHLLEVEVRVSRTLAYAQQIDEALLDDVNALAIVDAEALQQALEWPGNLPTTTGGGATGLVGCKHTGSRARVVGTAGKAQRLETVHAFTATITSSPASS